MDKHKIQQKIGEIIKEYRTMRGYSQAELAKAIGKTCPAYISLIEKGERNIASADLIILCNILKINLSKFNSL